MDDPPGTSRRRTRERAMTRVRVSADNVSVTPTLNDSGTARLIQDVLPLESEARRWATRSTSIAARPDFEKPVGRSILVRLKRPAGGCVETGTSCPERRSDRALLACRPAQMIMLIPGRESPDRVFGRDTWMVFLGVSLIVAGSAWNLVLRILRTKFVALAIGKHDSSRMLNAR